ncbi:MAG: 2Fe-2S iron-sulfur cluster binding domain-containing protein [Deltaproteobacteria bacterium]|jgi:NADH-quinone oxidoreductase subunit G|nr:2Fe-2S iron-sulfur cluster binding domain-containing protein [Deltaproteobacteria bacterium]
MKITIDNKEVEATEGMTVIEVADSFGIHIPRFCYHPELSKLGSCRMCLVEIEGMEKLVPSCTKLALDGMVVRTDTDRIKKARQDVLELLLINHPMDCPVCDASGECDLQNYYFEYSLKQSRFFESKDKRKKAIKIGPHLILDSERCVHCERCIRFCDETLKEHQLGVYGRGGGSQIDMVPNATLSNPYSMCVVDLCPTGALTTRDFRFKKRSWSLGSTPSICTGCATGCNVFMDHSDNVVYRYRPRINSDINGGMLCDYGRLSYKTINSHDRVLHPKIMKDGEMYHVTWNEALERLMDLVGVCESNIYGILSARSSVEDNVAFKGICEKLLCIENMYLSKDEDDPSFSDDLLKSGEKNPNLAGCSDLANGKPEEFHKGAGWIILDELTQDELLSLVVSEPKFVILISSSVKRGHRFADVVLPKPSHAEQIGTFINKTGRSQVAEKAFDPLGESMRIVDIGKRLADLLGKECNW